MTFRKELRISAITAALTQIDDVAADGDLAPDPAAPLELETGATSGLPNLHGYPRAVTS